MTILEAMQARHAVRSYCDRPIPEEFIQELNSEILACNAEGGLHNKLAIGEPKAFDGMMAHYGKFSGVKNYVALAGKKSSDLDEKLGYYGERIALKAQMLGLNTCWVALTFSKSTVNKIYATADGEKLVCVLALGYGTTEGEPHKSKSMDLLCKTDGSMPDWFEAGMEAAMCAPTAMNQQKFLFTLAGNVVKAQSTGGFYSKVDLGIVKYHFEIGAGRENFHWA